MWDNFATFAVVGKLTLGACAGGVITVVSLCVCVYLSVTMLTSLLLLIGYIIGFFMMISIHGFC